MAKGDHIFVEYPGFTHHAIDLGDGRVAEYGGKGSPFLSIRLVGAQEFFARGTVHTVPYPPGCCLPPDETVRLALCRLGERQYDPWNNNCEHFAHWCKTGQAWSPQAQQWMNALKLGGVVVALVAIAS